MRNNEIKLKYLQLFEKDLKDAVLYIKDTLNNPSAARDLADKVEIAILERMKYPTSFEPYRSIRKRKETYYCIHVDNYSIFYVVNDDVMELRRFIYSKRNIDEIL